MNDNFQHYIEAIPQHGAVTSNPPTSLIRIQTDVDQSRYNTIPAKSALEHVPDWHCTTTLDKLHPNSGQGAREL